MKNLIIILIGFLVSTLTFADLIDTPNPTSTDRLDQLSKAVEQGSYSSSDYDAEVIENKNISSAGEWLFSCEKDRFTEDKICFLFQKDLTVFLCNGVYFISVGPHDFSTSEIFLKIDETRALHTKKPVFSNALWIINNLKKGKIVYTRYKRFPNQDNIDDEIDLSGFSKKFDEMLKRYKQL